MEEPLIPTKTDQTPPRTPLPNHQQRDPQPQEVSLPDARLDHALLKLETFLTFLGFNQSTFLGFSLSWLAFLAIGVVVPVTILELAKCSGCEEYQLKDFELDIVASQACLAAVSLVCVSHYLRKYGIRNFLFVDRFRGRTSRFAHQYVQQIKVVPLRVILWLS